MKKLIIIVPAYCEENSIAETISALRGIQQQIEDLGYQFFIYIINDGSTDCTVDQARDASADRILQHHVNQGLGSAVRTGLQAGRRDGADIVVKFDADLQHDPNDILDLIQPILDDGAEVVYGNRFEKIQYKMPFVRRIGNIAFTRLMRWLTKWPVEDSQPGIFAVSKDYLNVSYIPGDYNYTQQILLDAYHKGMRFAQVPVTFNKRITGKSFVSLRYPFKVLPQIVQVLIGVKPLKIFGPVALFFLGISCIVASTNIFLWLFGNSEKPILYVNFVMGTGLFGIQTLFFGLLADLIVKKKS
ncbi:MAG: glycosyltransferase family 2 protein [Bacteroidota bacterium]